MHIIATTLLLLFLHASVAQTVSSSLPKTIDKKGGYLFYLHGGVVTVLGDNAINNGAPEWGRYEYSNILDSLRLRGFYVVSERRFPEGQLDSLLKVGVPVQNLLVVSASAGWAISYRVSDRLRNDSLHFVKIGGCRQDDYKEVEQSELHGHFLSIIEKSDPRGSCDNLFQMRKRIISYKQVVLNTGLSHGFFYKGRKEWIDPIVECVGKN